MNGWERHQRVPYLKEGFWRGDFGDGLTAVVFETPEDDGLVPWYVADSEQTGAKTVRQGRSANIEEAKRAAEAAVSDRKRQR